MSFLENPWNNAVTFLQMRFNQEILASGTGFFWRDMGRSLLVSNLHNFTGRDPMTGTPLSPSAGIPNNAVATIFRKVSEPDSEGFFAIGFATAEIQLYEHSQPRWHLHPTLAATADVAAIDISEIASHPEVLLKYANDLEGDADILPFVSQDVFVIGYPLGLLADGVPIPVWKRASIATDPSFDPGGKPVIYVDTATRAGMSGSVVLARHDITGNYRKKDGSTMAVLRARRDLILGIYSGRLGADHVQAQLGIVWKRRVIDELVEGMTTNSSS